MTASSGNLGNLGHFYAIVRPSERNAEKGRARGASRAAGDVLSPRYPRVDQYVAGKPDTGLPQ